MRSLPKVAYMIAATALFAGCGGSQSPIAGSVVPSDTGNSFPNHKTFHYTGSPQSFQVPYNVTKLHVVALGAAGAGGRGYFGHGGRVVAIIPVRPQETLYVVVGGQGSTIGGFNGGGDPGATTAFDYPGFGGGGASDVREGGSSLSDRVVVAAGGGGQGCCLKYSGVGGKGGGPIGEAGGNSYYGAIGGGGGTQYQGGAGGIGFSSSQDGFPGELGNGGRGGNVLAYYYSYCNSSNYECQGGSGGGGGGGYYGGGGGAGGQIYYSGGKPGAGGGGGSSYVERSAIKARFWRGWKQAKGNGLVVLSWR